MEKGQVRLGKKEKLVLKENADGALGADKRGGSGEGVSTALSKPSRRGCRRGLLTKGKVRGAINPD